MIFTLVTLIILSELDYEFQWGPPYNVVCMCMLYTWIGGSSSMQFVCHLCLQVIPLEHSPVLRQQVSTVDEEWVEGLCGIHVQCPALWCASV